MCLVVLFSDFGINTNANSLSRRPVPGRPRATTPAEDRFLAREYLADHFQDHLLRVTGIKKAKHDVRRKVAEMLHPYCIQAIVKYPHSLSFSHVYQQMVSAAFIPLMGHGMS
ncbi:hypothetical protein TNCV_2275401 [Trichonephila clavipes]|nr:hypothetical protein TNCV_2275401 [Trichonephila clavipes]